MEKLILEELIKQEKSQRKIAEELKISQTNVRYWLKKYGLKTIYKRKIIIYTCLNCGKDIKFTNGIKRKYCTSKCCGEAQIKKSYERLKLGKLSDPGTLRRTMLHYHKHKCQICGRKNWRKQSVPLIVDHINGDPYNNNLKNLRLICPNCDAQLPTYMGRNKGNGRWHRRHYYANGQRC